MRTAISILRCLALFLALHSFSAQGAISSLAFPELRNPYGLTIGPDKALYVCDIDNHRIWRIHQGKISPIAGNGTRGYSGDGASATNAQLNEPYEIRFASDRSLYFVEMKNHLVRKVSADGIISTVAGLGSPGFGGDNGQGTVQFNQPHSLQFGPDGAIYICDIGNHRIRKVDPKTGRVETFAGNGKREKTPNGASIDSIALHGPRALDFDAKGDLWLALREGNAIYRIAMAKRTIHHVAGSGAKGFTGHDGPAISATLSGPKGLAIGPKRHIYFADTESHSIRMVDPSSGLIHLVAGNGERGNGPEVDPRQCEMARPHGIYVHSDGVIYIGDSENNVIRVIR